MSDLDLHTLAQYLGTHVTGFAGLKDCQKFSDGQSNPTYLLNASSGQYVLRRQPFGKLLKSAHAVDREFQVLTALQSTEVPVPEALHLCQDPELIGSLFYVMSYEPGRVFWAPELPESDPIERGTIYRQMNHVLAKLHDVDIDAVGLQNFGRPGNYYERQVSRWSRQYKASETQTIEAMDELISWLPSNLPADDGKVSLIHGDYRIDNLIFHNEAATVRALLDWELSTLGHPYADLAYQCMQWRLDQKAPISGLGSLNREALGIPTEQEYVEDYCRHRKLSSIPHWDYYLVFSFFRLAAILQGVLKRALEGNASNFRAQSYGQLAPVLANMAMDIVNKKT